MTEATFYGRAASYTNASLLAVTLTYAHPRAHACYGAAVTFTLPGPNGMGLGGPVFFISNHTSNTVTIKSSNGTTITTVAQDHMAEICHIRQLATPSGWKVRTTPLWTPRTYSRGPRDTVALLPARCIQARFVLIPCDSPDLAVYSNDDELAALLDGQVLRIAGVCFRVYSVRNSGEHGFPVPDDVPVYPSCKYCMGDYGEPGAGEYQKGDGDDSGYDPRDQGKEIKWGTVYPDPTDPPQVITPGTNGYV